MNDFAARQRRYVRLLLEGFSTADAAKLTKLKPGLTNRNGAEPTTEQETIAGPADKHERVQNEPTPIAQIVIIPTSPTPAVFTNPRG